jgi:aryl-alcohol dehydrogenase
MKITAAVARASEGDYTIEEVELEPPRPDEILVEIRGAGFCHTDAVARSGAFGLPYPMVLGHEGSGVVVDVGHDVTKVTVGDHVAISFAYCGSCPSCADHQPAYCHHFAPLNYSGARTDGTSPLSSGGSPIASNFFGQSTLATHAITRENNVVVVDPSLPLELLGPLGCGFQTGAGAVLRSLDVQPGSSLLVLGGGPVGLAAVMAAASRHLATVIVSEPFAARRDLALTLGATHAIDPSVAPLGEQVRAIIETGVAAAFDTTGSTTVLEGAIASLAPHAALGLVGVPSDPAATIPLGIFQCLVLGITLKGIIEGDSDPDAFIPEMLDLYERGLFPFDKLITTYPLSQINEALAAQASGEVVKVVLLPNG